MAAALGIADLSQLPAYTLDLSLSDVEGRYEGQGRLRFTNTTGRAQARLPLLLHPNAPAAGGARDSGTIAVHALSCPERPGCSWAQEGATVATVTLDPPLLPGEAVTLELSFGGRLRRLSAAANDVFAQSMGGMGQLGAPVGVADYGLLGAGDGLLTVASAYPMLAPFVDGQPVVEAPSAVGDLAWNQPATFDLRVVTPTGLAVVTNLLDQAPEPISAEAWLTRAQGAGVRDLVLVASRTWERRETKVGPTTLRAWFLPQDAAAGEEVLATAQGALETYTDLLGPYPYRELDVVEASLVGGAGGVEFPAMVLIVVASNDYAWPGWQGITVIGDRGSTWAPARPVWNQYAYSITNVEADSGIPTAQQPNWRSWNNFRAAGSEAGPPTWKADLGLGEPALCLDECATEGHVLVWLPVQNSGLVDAGAFSVTLTVDDGGLSTGLLTESVPGLAAGASAVLGPWTIDAAVWEPGILSAVLDVEDTVVECDHEGNTLAIGGWPCP